jgi:OFA family oxalate/formate antiporter-like MFS transporter
MSIPGQTMGVSVFTDILIEKLGISRLNLSLTYMVGTTLSSLLLTSAGKFYDRHGVRLTILLSGSLLGLILIYLSQIDRLAQNAASFVFNPQIWGFILMIMGFFILRFSGQGVMTMVSRSMVMKWFDKRRGIAAAFMGIFISFGFSYAPRILDRIISRYSWRGAWQVMALVCGFGFGLFAFIFFRDNPEVCGLKKDGPGEIKAPKRVTQLHKPQELTLREAQKDPTLWIFSLSLAMLGLFNTAFTFHVVSLFESIGLGRTRAIAIFLPISLVSVSVQFIVSSLSDHIRLEYLFLLFLSAMATGMGALFFLGEGLPLFFLIMGMGVSGGTFGTLSSVTWVRLYGNTHLGAISGFAMGWTVVGSAVGPYMFSLVEKYTGSYILGSFICFSVTLGLLTSTALLLIRQRRKEKHSPT